MSAPRVLDFASYPAAGPELGPVVDHLRGGGLVAYPTETVYGLGGLVAQDVLGRLTEAKRRHPDKPFVLLVPSRDSVSDLAWSRGASELADVFWPGAVTLVLGDPDERFPPGVRSPAGTVAVRVSPHPLVRDLVAGLGEPLISTSANAPGRPPALSAAGALEAIQSLGLAACTHVLDGGLLEASAPSTIIDCSGEEPVMLREGTVPLGRVRCVLPDVEAAADA